MTATISVCLCTYKRPQLLDTLSSLQAQRLPPGVAMEISIADNDAQGSAKALVDRFRRSVTFKVLYEVQPEKNISCARNTTVKNASGDWLAFIDDDEIAEPDWLASLLACAQAHDADVVLGAVQIHYPPQTPEWILEGDYFRKFTPPTGTVMNVGSTCNALVNRRVLPDPEAPFDIRFGITGGGDTQFFNRMHRSGAKIVACREARVSETVEENRLNRDYLMRKATRIGETYAVIFFSALPLPARVWHCTRAAAQAAVAGSLALVCGPLSARRSFRYLMKMRANWGKVRFFINTPPVEIYK
ncbi:glycosyltransferase family 2 protein [Ferrimonas sediminicola]|uniref:Glycosyltransferase family 2 protein n=1 Tax=Ferrimonas sediminicola TaxID=2569538 RepID=A0A4U1BBM7_9GAMM|nr:glycosyltransferase family 2 protein [Ferrimonas sediminicola]TKB48191.1 glycosyltransferase family 2 protein [Ferrimonas sediminicola]